MSRTRIQNRNNVSLIEPLEPRTFLSYTPPVSGRSDINLDSSWKFIKQNASGAQAGGFDDSSWANVSLPHTWNTQDAQDGGNNYYQGVGWYRRHFTIPSKLNGKEFYLRFEGAMLETNVYVNGQSVGSHKGGYSAFVFDITPFITVGGDNVLAVKVDNSNDPNVAPYFNQFAPDWPKWGGLYRDVHIQVMNTLQVNPLDEASPGLFIKQSNVSSLSADLEITAEIRNNSIANRRTTLSLIIVDMNDARDVVASFKSHALVVAGHDERDFVFKTTLKHPHLWNGTADPHEYRFYIEVGFKNRTMDVFAQSTGLRYYSIDPQKGFLLNGKPYNLHGVSYYTDRLNEGSAVSAAERAQDIAMIQDIGATTVRLAHYQHAPDEYDLLDRDGIIAWEEIPLDANFNNSADFLNNLKQQLSEMVKQEYNHPSVVFLGLANELAATQDSYNLVTTLQATAKALDPALITDTASNLFYASDVYKFDTDVQGFNNYYGWYIKQIGDFPKWLDATHKDFPTAPIGISEYGAGGSVFQHQAHPSKPSTPATPFHPEEYEDLVHEGFWAAIQARPWIYGSWAWSMFDSASDWRDQGDTPGRVDKGLVTFDHKTKKDSYYFYKANWTDSPVLYITSPTWTDRPTATNDVKIYSNFDSVTLTINGHTVGSLKPNSIRVATWANEVLQTGANTITVTGTKNGKSYFDTVTWNVAASSAPPASTALAAAPALHSIFSDKKTIESNVLDN